MMIETLESRRFLSSVPSLPVADSIEFPQSLTTIPLTATRFKGTSVSAKTFSTRLSITLGKQLPDNTIVGVFNYLDGFKFVLRMRIGIGNTFHATITLGKLKGTLTSGRITTSDKGMITDLSGHYAFTNGATDSDSGTFLVHSY
jgi:hypothetical protein